MRKVIIVATALLFVSSIITSCKSHTPCNSYGKGNVQANSSARTV